MPHRPDHDADRTRRALLAVVAAVPALAATRAVLAEASTPDGGTGLPPDLLRAVREYDRATVGNDIAALAELVADDYVLVNSDSSLQNKPEYLADFNLPGFRIDPYVIEQPIGKAWGDAALTGGLLPLSWTQDGRRQSRRLRVAHVWVRQAGRWRIVYTQLTRVPD